MRADFLEVLIIRSIVLCRPVCDFLLNRVVPIPGMRMRAEKYRGFRSTLRCHRLKKISHALWVVTGLVEDDCADCIGLRFVIAGVLHHEPLASHLNAHLAKLPDQSTRLASHR